MQVDLIPGYRIKSKLGHGAFAQVYLAVQRSLDREIALKVMNPQMSTDKDLCERFIAEARVVASLRHRSIVSIHDVGKHEDKYYISMDLVGGSTLAEGIRRKELPAPALTVIRQIGEALGCAHQRGIVHRDVKPGNILFDSDGTAILTDFGIAKNLASDDQLTVVGSIIGTAAYMSPEQVSGEADIDGRTDLYSLGIVLYEMLTGTPPFRGKDHFTTALMHLSQPVPRLPAEHRRHQRLLDRLLAKDRDDRFASADALVRYFDEASSKSQTSADDELEDAGTMLRMEERETRLIPDEELRALASQRAHDPSSPRDRRRSMDSTGSRTGSRGAVNDGGRTREKARAGKSLLRWPILAGVGVSVLAVVLVLSFFNQNPFVTAPTSEPAAGAETGGVPDTGTPPTSDVRTADVVPPEPDVGRPPVDEETQKRIENLLTAANLNELVGRITDPPGSNAVEAYQAVLVLDPGNVTATEALERLGPQ